MFDATEIFRSVGDVWALGLFAALLLAVLVGRLVRRASFSRLRAFARDEEGASYALPYLLTFPVYLLVVCFLIQASIILMVKIGTMYAAHAAARAAIVWRSTTFDPGQESQDRQRTEKKAKRAAQLAMVPFASSYPRHLEKMYGGGSPTDKAEAAIYFAAYRRAANRNRAAAAGEQSSRYIRPDPLEDVEKYRTPLTTKYSFAKRATSLTLENDKNEWNADVTAKVVYKMPIHVPFANRLFGEKDTSSPYHVRFIESEARLPSETPKSENRRLGIPYDPEG